MVTTMRNNLVKEFVKKLDFTHGKYAIKEVFTDIVSLTAFTIQFGMLGNEEYVEKYENLLKKYSEKEQLQLKNLVIELANIYKQQYEPVDIMTDIFGELGLGNKNTAQFFTPVQISDLMAKIVGVNLHIENIEKDGYTTLHEPTSGAGGLILAYARELDLKGYDPSRNLYVLAWDIDILCTYMTYVQLSMYDIPAKVVNGNTLTLKENLVLYTPAYWRFMRLLHDGRLKIPTCGCCGKDIEGEPQKSMFNNKLKICTSCYATEKRLELLKKLMGGE